MIHRDIKPSNILISVQDGAARPKIIDFGIARSLDRSADDATVTAFGRFAGTPEYMSPEQAQATTDLDVRTDVYALGVLLYELITASTPLADHRLRQLSLIELCRVVREVTPLSPSRRLARPPRDGQAPAARVLPRDVRGDLDWIVMRCLEKEPEQRYPSAAALADDLRRHLADQPVSAGPPSFGYLLRKFARRRRSLLALLVVGLFGIVGSTLALSYGLIVARAERQAAEVAQGRAERSLQQAQAATGFLSTIIAGVSPEVAQGRDTALLRELLQDAARRLESELADQPDVAADMQHIVGKALLGLSLFREAEPHLTAALSHRLAAHGPDHPATIELRTQLAVQRIQAGRSAAAREILTDNLARAVRGLGPVHPQTAIASLRLAQSVRQSGDDPKELLQERLPDFEAALGATHVAVLGLKAELAALLLERGDFHAAILLYNELLAKLTESLGADAPQTIRATSNLARAHEQAGGLEVSLGFSRAAVAGSIRVFGALHADTLVARNNLGHLLSRLGRLDEAAEELEAVVTARETTLGPRHPSTLISLNNLAVVYRKAQRYVEVEPLLRRCLAALREVRGPRHFQTLVIQVNYADILTILDRAGDAEPCIVDAVAGFRELGESGRVALGSSLLTAGAILIRLGRLEQAEQALLESDRLLADLYGDTDSRRRVVYAQLQMLYEAWGRIEEATCWQARSAEVEP